MCHEAFMIPARRSVRAALLASSGLHWVGQDDEEEEEEEEEDGHEQSGPAEKRTSLRLKFSSSTAAPQSLSLSLSLALSRILLPRMP